MPLSNSSHDVVQWILNHAPEWLISSVITFITVNKAKYKYYDATKKEVSKGIMELGLRSLLKLDHEEAIPDYAQAIFVKYKGRTFKIDDPYCKFGERIRKTVVVVGGNRSEVSNYRALDYGVLGVANSNESLILYDFHLHRLYRYKKGRMTELEVFQKGKDYCYRTYKGTIIKLGKNDSNRDVMIAIPLKSSGKLVGGLTFDLGVGDKSLYQKFEETDSMEKKQIKESTNIKVFMEAYRCSRILVNAYFKTEGDEME